jgi:hypothetical protein
MREYDMRERIEQRGNMERLPYEAPAIDMFTLRLEQSVLIQGSTGTTASDYGQGENGYTGDSGDDFTAI